MSKIQTVDEIISQYAYTRNPVDLKKMYDKQQMISAMHTHTNQALDEYFDRAKKRLFTDSFFGRELKAELAVILSQLKSELQNK